MTGVRYTKRSRKPGGETYKAFHRRNSRRLRLFDFVLAFTFLRPRVDYFLVHRLQFDTFIIYAYEHTFSWRGKKQALRRELQQADSYEQWKQSALALDEYLGNEEVERKPMPTPTMSTTQ